MDPKWRILITMVMVMSKEMEFDVFRNKEIEKSSNIGDRMI